MSQRSRTQTWIDRLRSRSSAALAQPPTQSPSSGDATIEVSGTFLLDLLFGLGPYRALMLNSMVRYEIGRVNPDAWYERNRLVAALSDMGTKIGPHILFWIGKKTATEIFQRAETVAETPHDALVILDRRYRLAHRLNPSDGQASEAVGQWAFDRLEVGRGQVAIETPYPQQWVFGLLSGAVRDADPLVQIQAVPPASSPTEYRFELRWNL